MLALTYQWSYPHPAPPPKLLNICLKSQSTQFSQHSVIRRAARAQNPNVTHISASVTRSCHSRRCDLADIGVIKKKLSMMVAHVSIGAKRCLTARGKPTSTLSVLHSLFFCLSLPSLSFSALAYPPPGHKDQ